MPETNDDNNDVNDADPLAEMTADRDKWKALARKHEKAAKESLGAAEALAKLEQESKTESEKHAERIAKLEAEHAKAQADALRLRIAAKHKITDEDADLFLTGTDEDTLTAQAKRLADRNTERRKNGAVVEGEGSNNDKNVGNTEVRNFARQVFGRE